MSGFKKLCLFAGWVVFWVVSGVLVNGCGSVNVDVLVFMLVSVFWNGLKNVGKWGGDFLIFSGIFFLTA